MLHYKAFQSKISINILLHRMIRNVGKLPYEKNQIINYAWQGISIQLIFLFFCLLTWAYHKLLFAVKCWNRTKEGLLAQRKMDSNDISSFFFFLYFQTHSILSFGSAIRERSLQALGNFFPLQVNTFNQVKTSDIMK